MNTNMDFEQARGNMIEGQIRPAEVLDQRVLELFSEIHREDFMPGPYRQLALADCCIPLGHGQSTMTPSMEARLLQSVQVQADDRILEVGTGSAYLSALLGRSGAQVYGIELVSQFIGSAREKLSRYRIENVSLCEGDGLKGWPQEAPYDVMVMGGSLPRMEPGLREQLRVGGRLFVILGEAPAMEAVLITRLGTDAWATESLFETLVPPLIGARRSQDFQL